MLPTKKKFYQGTETKDDIPNRILDTIKTKEDADN